MTPALERRLWRDSDREHFRVQVLQVCGVEHRATLPLILGAASSVCILVFNLEWGYVWFYNCSACSVGLKGDCAAQPQSKQQVLALQQLLILQLLSTHTFLIALSNVQTVYHGAGSLSTVSKAEASSHEVQTEISPHPFFYRSEYQINMDFSCPLPSSAY